MKILVIGGTVFVGRHFVQAALERGHDLTLFNRGRSNPGLFPEVEEIHGDRSRDLSLLEGRRWDAILDTCGYLPRIVSASANTLADSARHYSFVSSVSIYADAHHPGLDEDAAVGTLPDPSVEEIDGDTYGPLKVLCELVVQDAFPGRSLIVRPGQIVGPYDPSDRFTYWADRVRRGGEILAPDIPTRTVQIIDARDLAIWMVRLIENQATGIFNAVGPEYRLTFAEFLDGCIASGGSDCQVTWVDEAFLVSHCVEEGSEIPLWFSSDALREIYSISNRKAIGAGLTFRSLDEITRDVIRWADTRRPDYRWRSGLSSEREKELLARWHRERSRP